MATDPRRVRFSAILAGPACVRPAAVYDPLSARIAEDLGFEMGMVPGSEVALAVLGAPDIALLTMTEFVEQVRRMTRAAGLPLMADADHGYGNALNVRRTVADLDAAGLCAVTIEDTDLPPPYGATRPRLILRDEAVGKLKAALAGRGDPAFRVVGRTNRGPASGLEETVDRVRAYAATGVDAVMVLGLRTVEELSAVSAAAGPVPLVLSNPSPALDDPALLSAHRVRIALRPGKSIAAAAAAVHDRLRAERGNAPPLAATPTDLLDRLTRKDDHAAAARDWLGAAPGEG